jgi:Kef-type K+ transport system membrane component KefB
VTDIHGLFIIAILAVLAPLLGRLPALAQTPVVVLELALGILAGPAGTGWVSSQGAIGFLGEFGLVFLFFQAGFEFKLDQIGTAAFRLGALAWLISAGLAFAVVGLLYLVGIVDAPLLVALVLPTTAFGILIPILHQSGDLGSEFGRYVLGAAAFGELGPMVLASVALAGAHHHLHQTILSLVFLLIAIGTIFFARRLRSDGMSQTIARWLGDYSILPVRISLLILLGLVSLASELGMEIVLGAYTAGMAIAMLIRGTKAEMLEDRLTALGSGFFIPAFFITSGVEFDLPALAASPASFTRFVLFCMAFLFIRFVPVRLYKKVLPERDLLPLALLSSTTLPLVVAVTYLGVRTGHMLPENASAIVGAAVLTVAVFPSLALSLRAKPEQAQSFAAAMNAAFRAAGRIPALLPRFAALLLRRRLERR